MKVGFFIEGRVFWGVMWVVIVVLGMIWMFWLGVEE